MASSLSKPRNACIDAICERMSNVAQAAIPSSWACNLFVERASKPLNSAAEVSQAVTNRSTQASKSHSKAVRGVVIHFSSILMQMTGVPASVHVFSWVRSGSSVSQLCSPWSIRVRPSSAISERVNRTVQNQLVAIIEAIPVTISPEITQGEIVSQRLICSVRVSNKLLFSFRKRRVSLSMVRRASLAMAVKSLLKLSSWDAIEAAQSWRIVSSSAFSFSLSRVGLPVFMENLSFQAPAFAGLGVLCGQVGFADAGQVETCIGKGIEHAGAILDQTHRNLIEDPRMRLVAALGTGRGFNCVAHLLGTLQLHRIDPAVALVHQVAQAVIGILIARRCDVEAAPGGQLQARCAEVQLDTILVAVTDPEHVILLTVQPGKSQFLEGVHHLSLLGFARRVLGGKADHARAVGPLVTAGIDQRLGAAWIAAQHFG